MSLNDKYSPISDKGIKLIAELIILIFDTDGDLKLNKKEFGKAINRTMKMMGSVY